MGIGKIYTFYPYLYRYCYDSNIGLCINKIQADHNSISINRILSLKSYVEHLYCPSRPNSFPLILPQSSKQKYKLETKPEIKSFPTLKLKGVVGH